MCYTVTFKFLWPCSHASEHLNILAKLSAIYAEFKKICHIIECNTAAFKTLSSVSDNHRQTSNITSRFNFDVWS